MELIIAALFVVTIICLITMMIITPISAMIEKAKLKKLPFADNLWQTNKWIVGFRYEKKLLNNDDLRKKSSYMQLAIVAERCYSDQWFEDYFKRLSVKRLPMFVFINWVLSIVENIESSSMSLMCVDDWVSYFLSGLYEGPNNDSENLEDYELACLWGAVYYYLSCFMVPAADARLLDKIESVGCRKAFAKPYFEHFKHEVSSFVNKRTAVQQPVFNFSGDLVLEKHVENEVDYVAAGGTGINGTN